MTGGGDELDAGRAECLLAFGRPFLLAHEPGHARHHQQEQRGGGHDQHELVGVVELLEEQDARGDQAGAAEERETVSAQRAIRRSAEGCSSVRIDGCRAAAPQSA